MESDEALLEAARTGDQKAFAQLVSRYESKVAGVVQSMLGRTQEAEDVGQEVFVRFYQSIGNFKGESSLGTYLMRIAINLSLNAISGRKRWFSLFKDDGRAEAVPTQEHTDVRETVRFELGRLEPDARAVITLRMLEGYSTAETAEILNVPLGTVLSRLSRAQQRLREALKKYDWV